MAAATLVQSQLELVRASLDRDARRQAREPGGVRRDFQGKPPVPPLATLAWKDWRGAALVSFPRQPGRAPVTIPTGLPPPGAAEPVRVAPRRAPPAAPVPPPAFTPRPRPSTAPSHHPPPFAPATNLFAPLPRPCSARSAGAELSRPRRARSRPLRRLREPVRTRARAANPFAPAAAAANPFAPARRRTRSPRAPQPIRSRPPAANPFVPPVRAPVRAHASRPAAVIAPTPAPPFVAAAQSSHPPRLRRSPAPRRRAVPQPFVPASAFSRRRPPPTVANTSPAAPPVQPLGRIHGEDLIADLFESMHDLHFARDAVDGGDFCLALAMAKLPSLAGIVAALRHRPARVPRDEHARRGHQQALAPALPGDRRPPRRRDAQAPRRRDRGRAAERGRDERAVRQHRRRAQPHRRARDALRPVPRRDRAAQPGRRRAVHGVRRQRRDVHRRAVRRVRRRARRRDRPRTHQRAARRR